MKDNYVAPSVLKLVTVRLENNLLEATLPTTVSSVETDGQVVQEHDASASNVSFNHIWVD